MIALGLRYLAITSRNARSLVGHRLWLLVGDEWHPERDPRTGDAHPSAIGASPPLRALPAGRLRGSAGCLGPEEQPVGDLLRDPPGIGAVIVRQDDHDRVLLGDPDEGAPVP